jgi:microcin C transport system substrate-binding protein
MVEFLSDSPIFERVFLFFKPSLERLGMSVEVRTVDEAQYENRLRGWDFDITPFAWRESEVPGSELRNIGARRQRSRGAPITWLA